jgi:hypothetical protein
MPTESFVSDQVKSGVLHRYNFNNPVVMTNFQTNQRLILSAQNFEDFQNAGNPMPFDVRSRPAISTPSVNGSGKVQWRMVDESGRAIGNQASPPAPRRPGGDGIQG